MRQKSSRTISVRIVPNGQATYFDTNTDWIDPSGELREMFRAMDAATRREAAERIAARFPNQQARAAVRNLAAEVDDEQLERESGAAAERVALDVLRRLSR